MFGTTATKRIESASGKEKKGVSPMSSSSTLPPERRRSLRPATPPGVVNVAKDHGKAPATPSAATGEPRKHVPNYLKPTISSNPDAAKQSAVRKQGHNESHKPTPTMMRRRSFDRPAQSSSAQRTTPPFSPKHSAAVTRRPASSSSDRTSKVVKAMKSQPPLLKTTKSMPHTSPSSGVKREAKSSNLKKPTPSIAEEEPVHAPNIIIESEADQEHESMDLNVEEELDKIEDPVAVDLSIPEKHFDEEKEHIDEENQSPKEREEENKETLSFVETTTISEDHPDEHDHHTPEPVTETSRENVEATHEETHVIPEVICVNEAPAEDQKDIQVVQQSQDTDENDQQRIQPVNESTPAEDNEDIQVDDQQSQHTDENDQQYIIQSINETPAEDTDIKEEEDTIEEITPDKADDHDSEGGNEQQNLKKEIVQKTDEEKKPENVDAENVVNMQRQVGGLRNKKESQQAYNDVIEETASRLVEKRVNKVRALAGAFETVISLQQPDSS